MRGKVEAESSTDAPGSRQAQLGKSNSSKRKAADSFNRVALSPQSPNQSPSTSQNTTKHMRGSETRSSRRSHTPEVPGSNPGPASNTTHIRDVRGKELSCPECGSDRTWKDGLRYVRSNGPVQRWLCRKCGFRFSQQIQTVQNVERQTLNANHSLLSTRRVCVPEAKGMINLVEVETRTIEKAAGATTPDPTVIKGKLVEFAWWMKKEGYPETTIGPRIDQLATLVKRGADLLDPESVKRVIAEQKTWNDGTKAGRVATYTCFLQKEGLKWNPPRYKRADTIPFIPSEAELNQLIGSCGKKLGTFLQGLKETGADPGELARISYSDVNKESHAVTINKPVKGHRPRIINVSSQLITRLEALVEVNGNVFDQHQLERAFYYKRKVTARKLANPRLLKVTFITFRHWFGTMEYHRTKDILHVQRLLGHRNIQNTLIYIDLETKLFNNTSDGFTSRVAHDVGEACQLVEAGFEYVTGDYSDGGKIFRRRA